jgi:micrococcal nuclease
VRGARTRGGGCNPDHIRPAFLMIRWMAIGLAAAYLVLLAAPSTQAAPPRSVVATVERVADGDTLMATTEDSTRLRIRLLGIDAPEMPHGRKPGQAYAEEARRHLVRLVLNRTVRVELFRSDAYRRLLAVIWYDGANLNVEMVRSGFAEVYRGTRCQAYCRELADAERRAQRERTGIWAQEQYESPAVYRKRHHAS